MFRGDEGSTGSTPLVPPGRGRKDVDGPFAQNVNRQDEGMTAASQNPGMFTGVIQKFNPFRSTSQVSKAPSPESLQQSRKSDSTRIPKNDPQDDSTRETGKKIQAKQNTGTFTGMMQKFIPFMSSQPKTVQPLHKELSSSSGSLAGNKTEKQENQTIRSQHSSSSGGLDDSTIQRHDSATVSSDTQKRPQDEEDLLIWWREAESWDKWNEAKQEDEAEELVEQAADRVFMAAQLFVHLFNQHGASLQQRILELLAVADSADDFHKKTVTASVGGGLASVAGSVTTITGLILAPFTAGTSLIVTAVGIGVATAGGLTSASANITDTVHSKTDRTKVEKMIQDYQEEMKDIKECLEFLQEGMETLAEWNFEKYAESISQKYLNQNVKHVMKEGGRAGKALVINTESLISTVQALSVAGGAAKAAQVMSITTGVMSGLFLALDVFFLAKDSMELKKGAKTEFAAKIREVCKDLQDGLLELNHIKEQLQKTMAGIQEEQDEDQLKSDLKKGQ